MKASKLMDSLNYLDDDLIAESEETAKVSPIVSSISPRKNRTLITVLSIAASLILLSAVVLSVGKIMGIGSSKSNDVSEHYNAHADKDTEQNTGEETAAADIPEIAEEEEYDETVVENCSIIINDLRYVETDRSVDESVIGDKLGKVEDSDNADYIGCEAYQYSDTEIVIAYENSFILFEVER